MIENHFQYRSGKEVKETANKDHLKFQFHYVENNDRYKNNQIFDRPKYGHNIKNPILANNSKPHLKSGLVGEGERE